MPNWKKMAEAFGRATRGRNNAENPAIKAARDSYGRDLNNYGADKNARDRAESFHAGEEERWLKRDEDADAFEDKLSDKRLTDDFENEFEQAYKSAQADRKLDGGFDSDDDIRVKMIEELKSGIDLSDFFEKYRK